ncbi:MAG: hemerythrin domain-containing protein [Candidatus Eremiobacteraeota bacterium]|nr:hemerythrin domain-containing protein [Candidatus Eremiobacteraeota bacterium]
MSDAIELLKADHRKVEALLKEIQELPDTAHERRASICAQVSRELKAHDKIETTIFYPALKAKTTPDTEPRDEVLEAYEEHANIAGMLEKLAVTAPTDESYNAKLQVLGELVKHHVKEEEHEMFKQARELLSESELKELGERIEREKQQLVTA